MTNPSRDDMTVPAIETFDALFASEYPAVARIAFLLLGNSGEAEEATQDAFVTLLQRWDRVQTPSAFVRTAVINRCRDIGRRRQTLRRLLPRARRGTSDNAEREYLVDALQALDIDLRELVVYRYYIGHTVPEISAILGIAEGTVKSRLHRALDKLEAALTDQSTRSRVNPVNAGSSDGHAAS